MMKLFNGFSMLLPLLATNWQVASACKLLQAAFVREVVELMLFSFFFSEQNVQNREDEHPGGEELWNRG